MEEIMEIKNMEEQVLDVLRNSPQLYLKDMGGTFYYSIYADYRDTMEKKTAVELLEDVDPDCPEMGLDEKLYDWYQECEYDTRCDIRAMVFEELEKAIGRRLTDEEEMEVESILLEKLFAEYPYDHYLNQSFPVNITIDTGDANYDFYLNCPDSWENGRIDKKASIVWLAKTQGYTKMQLQKAMKKKSDSTFLNSVFDEVNESPSSMNALTFLCTMTFRDLLEVNAKLKSKDPFFLNVPKSATCGLYDSWNGSGAIFEIKLEKDVLISSEYIRSVLPDGGEGRYSVEDVYGMCGSVWETEAEFVELKEKKRRDAARRAAKKEQSAA